MFNSFSGISNKLVPIQIVHGFSPAENDRLGDHLKQHQHQHQHQHQVLSRGGHDFIKNIQQHVKAAPPFGESHHVNAKILSTADNIAISDVSSNEQMLYFSNDNVKGNYAWNIIWYTDGGIHHFSTNCTSAKPNFDFVHEFIIA